MSPIKSKLISATKILFAFFKTFLSSSNVHGFGHISNPKHHTLEALVWLSLVSLAVYSTSVLSRMTLTRYQENPTVISIERDRFAWNTSFPGATICPVTKLSPKALEQYVKNSKAGNKTALREFLVSLSEATYGTLDKVKPYDGISSDQYLDLLLKLRFQFEPPVTNSGVNTFQSKMDLVVSEMGICYSFNSQLAAYNSPTYWKRGQWKLLKSTPIFYINPMDGEVYVSIVNMSTGVTIYTHGPYEVADAASKSIFNANGFLLQMYLNAMSLYSTERTRALAVRQRKCRYYDESNLHHSPVYSYVLCRVECRITLARALCGCIPHFYRQLDNDKVCDVSGLHCLSKYTERLITLKGECSCLPNCEEVTYTIESADTREWFLGSNLAWGVREYPNLRLKRDVIFGFTDLLVYVGGLAGLFLGCSVLSFIEILYFFSVRFFWFVNDYRKVAVIKL